MLLSQKSLSQDVAAGTPFCVWILGPHSLCISVISGVVGITESLLKVLNCPIIWVCCASQHTAPLVWRQATIQQAWKLYFCLSATLNLKHTYFVSVLLCTVMVCLAVTFVFFQHPPHIPALISHCLFHSVKLINWAAHMGAGRWQSAHSSFCLVCGIRPLKEIFS